MRRDQPAERGKYFGLYLGTSMGSFRGELRGYKVQDM